MSKFDIAASIPEPSQAFYEQAQRRQLTLTKPAGSLGQLELIAEQFAGWQGAHQPSLDKVQMLVFAADHGIASPAINTDDSCNQHDLGVSAFPQSVTQQMVVNFCQGGAAVSVLCRDQNIAMHVVNMGTVEPMADADSLINIQLANGTDDFAVQPAMTMAICQQAMTEGAAQIDTDTQLFIAGEMGIGNTSAASALMAALMELPVSSVVGRGTGIDDARLRYKIEKISAALSLHHAYIHAATDNERILRILQCLGGLEIAAIVGAYIRAAQLGIPALVDGYITTVAALVACRLQPSVRQWLLFSHCSAEQAHQALLTELDATPLLDLGMRLGEGSGAAVAVSLIRTALSLHNQMSTFAEAAVSSKC